MTPTVKRLSRPSEKAFQPMTPTVKRLSSPSEKAFQPMTPTVKRLSSPSEKAVQPMTPTVKRSSSPSEKAVQPMTPTVKGLSSPCVVKRLSSPYLCSKFMLFSSQSFFLLAQHIESKTFPFSKLSFGQLLCLPSLCLSKVPPFFQLLFQMLCQFFAFLGSFFALHLKQLLPAHNSDSPASCGLVVHEG